MNLQVIVAKLFCCQNQNDSAMLVHPPARMNFSQRKSNN